MHVCGDVSVIFIRFGMPNCRTEFPSDVTSSVVILVSVKSVFRESVAQEQTAGNVTKRQQYLLGTTVSV